MPLNRFAARALRSATTNIDIAAATAPSDGQVLTATSSTAAVWETPAGGGGETSVTIVPQMGAVDNGAAFAGNTTPEGFGASVEFSDAASEDWILNATVPDGADGLGISAIKVIYVNKATPSKNIVLKATTMHLDFTNGGASTADTTGTERAYATPATDNTVGIITLNADVYNSLPSPMSKGDIIKMTLSRIGGSASDTYNLALYVLAVRVEFA